MSAYARTSQSVWTYVCAHMRMCACVHVCVRAGVRACVRFADVLTDKFDLVHSFRFRKDAKEL